MKQKSLAFLFALCLLILGQYALAATRTGGAHAAKGKMTRLLNANAWQIQCTNYGPFVYPASSNSGGTWNGPGYSYIYGGGLWFGAKDSAGTPQVSYGYNPTDGGSMWGPCNPYTPYDWVNYATDPLARLFLSTNPADMSQWPVKDAGGNNIVKSVQDGYSVYSDQNPAFMIGGNTSIGVVVKQWSYAWNFGGNNNIVYFFFRLLNVSGDSLYNAYLGPAIDADVGYESGTIANDRTDFDFTRNLAIQYQTEPEAGWPQVGVLGCRFFESPRNNSGDTVHVVDNQYPHSIPPDSMLGMTAFKIFTIDIDPANANERYQEMQGITHTTAVMDAYDEWGAAIPGDKRFIMSSGPFNMAAGESVSTCIAVMAAWDTAALKTLSDYSQIVYDHNFATLPITITSPNGGEIVSGTTNITWNAAAPACLLNLYCSADEGQTWMLITDSIPNTGSYSWNTTGLPDGVRYRVNAFIYNDTSFGGDQSDGIFTVSNAAYNAKPEIRMIAPVGGESWSGPQYLKYYYGHADNNVCWFDFQLKGPSGTWDSLITVTRAAQLWTRDSLPWNTATVPNFPYYTMRTRVTDYFDTVVVLSDTFAVDNQYPDIDSLRHASGSCDVALINPYVVDAGLLTGHHYEFRFRAITRGTQVGSYYQPRYSYDLWDVDLNAQVLSDQGITVPMDSLVHWDVPAPLYGFEPEVRYCVDGNDFTADSARITTDAGAASVDTVRGAAYPSTSYRWMSRSATYEIRWHVRGTYPNDTLTADVWDVDNNVVVPLDTLPLNSLTRSAWSYGPQPTNAGRSYIASGWPIASRSYLFICGAACYFNRGTSTSRLMTWSTHPVEGEVWTLYTHGPKPPRDGDVYSFLGVNGVAGQPGISNGFALMQNRPNPFSGATTLHYQLSGAADVSLKVYNIAGQQVRTLVSSRQAAGMHSVRWDGRNNQGQKLSAGVYLYQLQMGTSTVTKKMVLLR